VVLLSPIFVCLVIFETEIFEVDIFNVVFTDVDVFDVFDTVDWLLIVVF
jgi:hypothetical protein